MVRIKRLFLLALGLMMLVAFNAFAEETEKETEAEETETELTNGLNLNVYFKLRDIEIEDERDRQDYALVLVGMDKDLNPVELEIHPKVINSGSDLYVWQKIPAGWYKRIGYIVHGEEGIVNHDGKGWRVECNMDSFSSLEDDTDIELLVNIEKLSGSIYLDLRSIEGGIKDKFVSLESKTNADGFVMRVFTERNNSFEVPLGTYILTMKDKNGIIEEKEVEVEKDGQIVVTGFGDFKPTKESEHRK